MGTSRHSAISTDCLLDDEQTQRVFTALEPDTDAFTRAGRAVSTAALLIILIVSVIAVVVMVKDANGEAASPPAMEALVDEAPAAPEHDDIIAAPVASTEHSEGASSPAGPILDERGATNGTLVTDERIEKQSAVDAEVFTLGQTVFKFNLTHDRP